MDDLVKRLSRLYENVGVCELKESMDRIEQQASRIAELESRNAQLQAWVDAVMAQPVAMVLSWQETWGVEVPMIVRPKPLEVK